MSDARRRRHLFERMHSPVPFGLGERKPHHFLDMLKVVWANRDNLGYAWKVLTRGVCDGCALGTSGLKDWTIDGTHLCLVRLELLRLNTMGALDVERLRDVSTLANASSKDLRALGRVPYPLRRRRGSAASRGSATTKYGKTSAHAGARSIHDAWRCT
jgi:hypothetical protein